MINVKMAIYKYYKYSDKPNSYGQITLSNQPSGEVKMAIFTTSQSIQDNINYKNANYIGLTHSLLDDKTVIDYKGKKLKVLYINSEGRLNQVFLTEI